MNLIQKRENSIETCKFHITYQYCTEEKEIGGKLNRNRSFHLDLIALSIMM